MPLSLSFFVDGSCPKTARLRVRLLALLAPGDHLKATGVANLVWAPEVAVRLTVLPGLTAEKACRPRTLMALAYANTAEIFATAPWSFKNSSERALEVLL